MTLRTEENIKNWIWLLLDDPRYRGFFRKQVAEFQDCLAWKDYEDRPNLRKSALHCSGLKSNG